ncbi:MAG: PAS domain-containing protein [Candidatus Bipolaricaulis sp.]|nr:PAS domain-containing protein [Candidatus Bipolaricaulis sp.]
MKASLSETILRLSQCASVDQICALAASTVHALLPGAYVVVTLYDAEIGAIRWRCDCGFEAHEEFLTRLLGPDRTTWAINRSETGGGAAADVSGRLVAYPGGLFELLGGTISKPLCALVRRTLSIGSVHHVAFSLDGKPIGGVTVLLRRGGALGHVPSIEGIARHASVEILRLAAQAEIRRIAGRLALATESARIGVWDLDLVHDRLEWDPRMFELYGIAPLGFAGSYAAWQRAIHPDDAEAAEGAMQEAIRSGQGYHTHFRVVWPSGEVRHLEAHAVVVRRADGAPERMIGVNWDVTDRSLTEERLRARLEGTVRAVSALTDLRDPYTAGHQHKVTRLACAAADAMHLPADRREGLRVAALLHDIGKISVPAEILAKPSELTPVEFGLIKAHPRAAYDVLCSIDFPWPVADIVLQHHELLDGSGYPQGLRGEAILLEARILAVADVVEAMCSHRPYRPALGLLAALDELRTNRGVLYDSDVVDACIGIFSRGEFALAI